MGATRNHCSLGTYHVIVHSTTPGSSTDLSINGLDNRLLSINRCRAQNPTLIPAAKHARSSHTHTIHTEHVNTGALGHSTQSQTRRAHEHVHVVTCQVRRCPCCSYRLGDRPGRSEPARRGSARSMTTTHQTQTDLTRSCRRLLWPKSSCGLAR